MTSLVGYLLTVSFHRLVTSKTLTVILTTALVGKIMKYIAVGLSVATVIFALITWALIWHHPKVILLLYPLPGIMC